MLKPGALHLSMSTISPGMSSTIAAEHVGRGQNYVAAPVFGNPDAAKARELYVIAAGKPGPNRARQAHLRPSRSTDLCRRPRPGKRKSGQARRKRHDRHLLGGARRSSGSGAQARRRARKFIDIMTSTMFGSRVHKIYGAKMVHHNFTPGFAFPFGPQGCPLGAVGSRRRERSHAVGRCRAQQAGCRSGARPWRPRLGRRSPSSPRKRPVSEATTQRAGLDLAAPQAEGELASTQARSWASFGSRSGFRTLSMCSRP